MIKEFWIGMDVEGNAQDFQNVKQFICKNKKSDIWFGISTHQNHSKNQIIEMKYPPPTNKKK
jgi:hypothetical protein